MVKIFKESSLFTIMKCKEERKMENRTEVRCKWCLQEIPKERYTEHLIKRHSDYSELKKEK